MLMNSWSVHNTRQKHPGPAFWFGGSIRPQLSWDVSVVVVSVDERCPGRYCDRTCDCRLQVSHRHKPPDLKSKICSPVTRRGLTLLPEEKWRLHVCRTTYRKGLETQTSGHLHSHCVHSVSLQVWVSGQILFYLWGKKRRMQSCWAFSHHAVEHLRVSPRQLSATEGSAG